MKAALQQKPSKRLIAYYEPGEIPDVPHYLVYDPNDQDLRDVIERFKETDPTPRNCAISAKSLADSFFDLAVDCH